MDRPKKNNLISLKAYLKKKKKLKFKKAHKVASDQSPVFVDHEKPIDDNSKKIKNNKKEWKSNIHYMDNYLKTRRPFILKEDRQESEKHRNMLKKRKTQESQKKSARIIKFSKYKKQKFKVFDRKNNSSEDSEPIDINDYRENKNRQIERERKINSLNPFKRAAKEMSSVIAMALMMLFAFHMFFSKDGSIKPEGGALYYAQDVEEPKASSPEIQKRGLASPEKSRQDEIESNNLFSMEETRWNKNNNVISRSLSSLFDFSELNSESSFQSARYIRYIKSKDFKDEQVIVGKKPHSSVYKGF